MCWGPEIGDRVRCKLKTTGMECTGVIVDEGLIGTEYGSFAIWTFDKNGESYTAAVAAEEIIEILSAWDNGGPAEP